MNSADIDLLLDEIYDLNVKFIPRKVSRFDEAPKEDSSTYEKRRRSLSPVLTEIERDKRTVFVRQLSQKITSPILQEFFEKAGPVRQVKMVLDRVSKRPKGFAYVEFRNPDSVQIAVTFTGQKILGVPVIVEITETEKNRIAEEAAEALYMFLYS